MTETTPVTLEAIAPSPMPANYSGLHRHIFMVDVPMCLYIFRTFKDHTTLGTVKLLAGAMTVLLVSLQSIICKVFVTFTADASG